MARNYFEGKVAVVTGGASGIGRALAVRLFQVGAKVHIVDLNDEALTNVRANYPKLNTYCGDLTDLEQTKSIVNAIRLVEKRIDLLFNSIGVGFTGEFKETSIKHWQHTTNVNLNSVYYSIHCVYPIMQAQGYGQMVIISSMAGLIIFPLGHPYAASKYATFALSRVLRVEGACDGIKVNVVCPGYVESNLLETSTLLGVDKEYFLSKIPFPKMTAEKAAKIILKSTSKNKAILVFPFYAKFIWWLTRIFPTVLDKLYMKKVLEFRTMQKTHPAIPHSNNSD